MENSRPHILQRWLSAAFALNAALMIGCQASAPPATPPSPRVFITEPLDGAEVAAGTVRIVMSVENIQLAPAGDQRAGTGHLHLFINQPVTELGIAIPAGAEGIVHLGQGQTSHELTGLAPGEYTVIAVLGDFAHRTINQITDTVRFIVR